MFDQDTRNRQVFKQDFLFILIPGYIMRYNKVKIIIKIMNKKVKLSF